MEPVSFPAHALLILEERLKERQREDGWPPPDADITEVALVLLVGAELTLPKQGATYPRGDGAGDR
jgi:hypothetical protein